ncbi:hypothetical protein ABE527_14635 [Brucella sp. TWI432]
MSALAVAVGTDGIIVASDGVCHTYDTGEVHGFVSKFILLPEYNCFIGSTGAGGFCTALRWEITQQINSFDDLVEGIAEFCKTSHQRLFSDIWGNWDRGPHSEAACVIGGWSDERQAYEAYRVVSYEKPSVTLSDGNLITLEPFVRYPLPAATWCSHLPDTMHEFDLVPPLPNEETGDILMRLVCACRADSGLVVGEEEREGDDRYYMAGGFIQMAVIQEGTSQSWIAHRWPEDQIGKQIDPNGPERYPAWLKERYEQAKSINYAAGA